YRRAVDRLRKLRGRAGQVWDLLALGLIGEGVCLREDRRFPEAETAFDQAIRLLAPCESDAKAGRDARFLLALAHNERGRLHAEAPVDRARAAGEFDAARTRLVRLCQDFPGQVDYRSELATAYAGAGALGVAAGRYDEAETDLREARAILEDLFAT